MERQVEGTSTKGCITKMYGLKAYSYIAYTSKLTEREGKEGDVMLQVVDMLHPVACCGK